MDQTTCMITGATSGVGAAAAEALAKHGWRVVIVGRDRAKCEAAVDRLRAVATGAPAGYLVADLSVRADVRQLVQTFERQYSRLDVLINNAGGIFLRRSETVDGIERTFALNHLAYFLLTNLLVERLKASAPARVINVASSGHMLASGINFEDLQNRRFYRGFAAYHQSKLANIMFTYELARRLHGTGVTVNAVHPGMVATNIGKNNGWIWRLAKPVADKALRMSYVTPEEGARSVVYLACSPDVADVTGRYFVDQRPADSSTASHDRTASCRLWGMCNELTGLSAAADDS